MAQPKRGKHKSKFRHIYGELSRPEEQILEIPTPLTSGEGPYVKSGGRYFAFAGSSVGKLYVKHLSDFGRMTKDAPYIGLDCLKGKIWDFAFHPFIDNIVAMGDDSGKVAIATIPKNGLSTDANVSNVTEATVDFGTVHSKKVTLVDFHPCANAILSSASFDKTVNIYNVETQSKILTFENPDTIYSFQWSNNGSQMAVSSKDKKIRMFDPRTDTSSESNVQVVSKAFDGSKSSKVFWMPRFNWIGCCGFNKQAKRELKFWDLRDLNKPLYSNKVDQASSVLMPHWDDDNGILYLPGKGEGTVQFGEIVNDKQKYHAIGAYRDPQPQKGGGWVPKRSLNVWKCEVQRFLKLTDNAIKAVSFIVPRKTGADTFQGDIYPDCVSNKPGMSADEWTGGENKPPMRMTLDPGERESNGADGVDDDGKEDSGIVFKTKKSYAQIEKENSRLRMRVAELEKEVKMLRGQGNDNDNDNESKEKEKEKEASDEKVDDKDDVAATTTAAPATDETDDGDEADVVDDDSDARDDDDEDEDRDDSNDE